MRFIKINDNKLEVLIESKDLEANDISIQDFMCSSVQRHSFLFSIIGLANKEIGFNFKNCEILLESYSLPSIQSFIITITKVPYKLKRIKYKRLKFSTYFLGKFKNFEVLCTFCSLIKSPIISTLFFYNGYYFLNIKVKRITDLKNIVFNLKEFAEDYKINSFLDENADIVIKNNAVEICKKTFT